MKKLLPFLLAFWLSLPIAAQQTKPVSIGSQSRYRPGQRVAHAKFGAGIILQIEGEGAQERVQINFPQPAGMKWLMVSYAQLEVL